MSYGKLGGSGAGGGNNLQSQLGPLLSFLGGGNQGGGTIGGNQPMNQGFPTAQQSGGMQALGGQPSADSMMSAMGKSTAKAATGSFGGALGGAVGSMLGGAMGGQPQPMQQPQYGQYGQQQPQFGGQMQQPRQPMMPRAMTPAPRPQTSMMPTLAKKVGTSAIARPLTSMGKGFTTATPPPGGFTPPPGSVAAQTQQAWQTPLNQNQQDFQDMENGYSQQPEAYDSEQMYQDNTMPGPVAPAEDNYISDWGSNDNYSNDYSNNYDWGSNDNYSNDYSNNYDWGSNDNSWDWGSNDNSYDWGSNDNSWDFGGGDDWSSDFGGGWDW